MSRQMLWLALALSFLLMSRRRSAPSALADHPRLAPGVALKDVTFRSASLDRDMHYRMLLPRVIKEGDRFPVIYLLHGGGGSYLDWTNYSDVSQFVEQKIVLVIPQGDESYCVNSVGSQGGDPEI